MSLNYSIAMMGNPLKKEEPKKSLRQGANQRRAQPKRAIYPDSE